MRAIAPDDQQLVDRYLDRAMAEFATSRLAGPLMRRLAKQFPNELVLSALRYLDTNDESNAHWFLTNLLARQPAIFDQLSDPALRSREQATQLMRRFLAVDPAFDVHLAHRLPDRTGENHETAFDSVRAARTLDLLEETSSGRRLLSVLGHLLNSADPRISARAVLFIGRRVQSAEWVRRQLERGDPRARASAIEAVWGMDSPDVTCLLEGCVGDENNRVAGNALIGLSMAGSDIVAGEVMRMSAHSDAPFRATAAWMMGRIGDLAFLEHLQRLVRDDSALVKGAALRAMLAMPLVEARAGVAEESKPEAPAQGDPMIEIPQPGGPVSKSTS